MHISKHNNLITTRHSLPRFHPPPLHTLAHRKIAISIPAHGDIQAYCSASARGATRYVVTCPRDENARGCDRKRIRSGGSVVGIDIGKESKRRAYRYSVHSRSYSVRRPRTRTEHVFAAKKEGDGKRVAVEGGVYLPSLYLSLSLAPPLDPWQRSRDALSRG